jgi:hypothetical protein
MATLAIKRGDTRKWTLAFFMASGDPQTLSGATVWWTVRPSVPADPAYDLPDAEATIKAWWQHNGASVVTSGVTGPDGQPGGSFTAPSGVATGELLLTLLPSLTTKLSASPAGGGQFRYDVQISWSATEIATWDEGSVQISPDVTRRVTVP